MYLAIALGVLSILVILLQPLKYVLKKRAGFASLGNKSTASLLFCIAAAVAVGMREDIPWQVAVLLFGLCLAAVGDVLLAMGPVFIDDKIEKFIFPLGRVCLAAAFGMSLLALFVRFGWNAWGLAEYLTVAYVLLFLPYVALKKETLPVLLPYYLAQAVLACVIVLI